MNIDKIIAPDKQKHFVIGLVTACLFAHHPTFALIATVVVAFGKELYDLLYNYFTKSNYHGAELMDALFTVCGGLVGLCYFYSSYLVINKMLLY